MKYRLLETDLEPGGLRTNHPEWTEGVEAGTWVIIIIKLEKGGVGEDLVKSADWDCRTALPGPGTAVARVVTCIYGSIYVYPWQQHCVMVIWHANV